MKSKLRCIACGRVRKPSHEKRCGTPKAYSPECVTYEKFDGKAYRAKLKAIVAARVAEAESKIAKIKADAEAKIKEEADAKAKAEADAKIEAAKVEAEAKAKAQAEADAKAQAKEAKAKEAEIKRAEAINAKVEAEAKATGGIAAVETTCTIPTPEQVESSVLKSCEHVSNLVDQATTPTA